MHRTRGGQRQEHRSRLIAKRNESMVPVERCRRVVLGVDHKCEAGDFGIDAARQSVGQQSGAKPFPACCLIDRQPPHANCRHGGVSWQFLDDDFGQIGQEYAGGSQRIKTSNAILLVERHKTARDPTANVLRYALAKIAVKRFDPAMKATSFTLGVKRRNPIPCRHQPGAINFRRRANARFNAAFGFGGEAMARAKRS